MKVALVGDYDATVLAHQAIPGAIERSALALATTVELIWIHSSEIDLQAIAAVDALWCVPLSPYAYPEAVITVKPRTESILLNIFLRSSSSSTTRIDFPPA